MKSHTLMFAFLLLIFGSVLATLHWTGFFEREIGETRMDEPRFAPSSETMTLSMADLPFQVDVPDFWSFNEDEISYRVSYHEGLEGALRFYKEPSAEVLRSGRAYDLADSRLQLNCTVRFCEVTSSVFEGRYRVSVDERPMQVENLEKMWRVLRSVRLD